MTFGQKPTPFMTMEQQVIDGKLTYIDYPIDMDKAIRGMYTCEEL